MTTLTLLPDLPGEPATTPDDATPTAPRGRIARLRAQWRADRERGAATAEYAVTIIAAVGLAGLLVTILASSDVRALLLKIVKQALTI